MFNLRIKLRISELFGNLFTHFNSLIDYNLNKQNNVYFETHAQGVYLAIYKLLYTYRQIIFASSVYMF